MLKTRRVWGTLFTAFILILLLTNVYGRSAAAARISYTELDAIPAVISGVVPQDCTRGRVELPPQSSVEEEVNYLSNVLPVLDKLNVQIYTVHQRCNLPGLGMLAGCNLPGSGSVYLFASPQYASYKVQVRKGVARLERYGPYLASYTVAHEMGHVVRYQLLKDKDMQRYLDLRGGIKKETTGTDWANDAEEVFAEDFRWLFGSDNARQIPYLCNVTLPGEKEKQFLLEALGS